MHSSSPVRRAHGAEPLVKGPVAEVDHCPDCGVLSIHLGATTLRLDEGAAESLWATLSEALAELHRRKIGALALSDNRPRGVA